MKAVAAWTALVAVILALLAAIGGIPLYFAHQEYREYERFLKLCIAAGGQPYEEPGFTYCLTGDGRIVRTH